MNKKRNDCTCLVCTCDSGSRVASAIIAALLVLVFLYFEFFWK